MYLDQKLIKLLEKKLQCNIDKVRKKRRKKTSRAPISYVISLKKSSFLLLEASTPIEKFYASRSIRYQSVYNDGNLFDFETLTPIYAGDINNKRYVLYRYYENFKYVKKYHFLIIFLWKLWVGHRTIEEERDPGFLFSTAPCT